MIVQALRQWLADWLGRPPVERRGEGGISPFTALQQALAILALVFAGQFMTAIAQFSAGTILAVRIALLLVIIILGNYVVVAKQPGETTEATGTSPKPVYRYTEIDRITSKILLPCAVVLLVILAWPEPQPCYFRAEITYLGARAGESGAGKYLELTGGGTTSHIPLAEDGSSVIMVNPKQQKKWTLSLIGLDGAKSTPVELKGCPHEKCEFQLNETTRLILRPKR